MRCFPAKPGGKAVPHWRGICFPKNQASTSSSSLLVISPQPICMSSCVSLLSARRMAEPTGPFGTFIPIHRPAGIGPRSYRPSCAIWNMNSILRASRGAASYITRTVAPMLTSLIVWCDPTAEWWISKTHTAGARSAPSSLLPSLTFQRPRSQNRVRCTAPCSKTATPPPQNGCACVTRSMMPSGSPISHPSAGTLKPGPQFKRPICGPRSPPPGRPLHLMLSAVRWQTPASLSPRATRPPSSSTVPARRTHWRGNFAPRAGPPE